MKNRALRYFCMRYFYMPIIIFMLAFLILSSAGCRQDQASVTEVTAGQSQETEDAPASTQTSEKTTDTDKSTSTSSPEAVTEPAEVVPEEIIGLVEEADGYYLDKDYGLAKNTYRKAEIAIDDSDLSYQKKQELKDSFYSNYEKAKNIIETARMHFTNAKQLEYEQRFEEALKELEAAIAIYPKYEEAIEAYENLKALTGL